MALMPKADDATSRSHDIIHYILTSNEMGVRRALADDPNCVNAKHAQSGMNAAMLCVAGRMPNFFNLLIEYGGSYLDFSHTDEEGEDLQEIALGTLHRGLMDAIEAAYEAHAPHIINNWPEP